MQVCIYIFNKNKMKNKILLLVFILLFLSNISAFFYLAWLTPEFVFIESMLWLILTAISNGPDVLQCVDAGAKGYVLKDVDVDELARTIRAIHRGESVLDSKVTRAVLERARNGPNGSTTTPILSDQERAIVTLIAEGLTNKEIGEKLFLSASTVKFHISDVMQKLDVKRRAQVVFKAAGDHLI